MPSIGPPEILLVVGVIVLLFGAKRLPEIARSMGKAKNEFKKGLQDGEAEASSPPTESETETAKTSEKT